jgi:hypothetical protein
MNSTKELKTEVRQDYYYYYYYYYSWKLSLKQALPFCSICQCSGEIPRRIYCPSCFPTLNAATCTQLIIS